MWISRNFLNRCGQLPDNHVVLHDVESQFGNIDHLVFRNDGAVFLVETKSHKGTVDETRALTFIPQTHRKVFWLRDRLKARLGFQAWIEAAIVFPNAHVTVRRKLRGVDVVSAHYLERWMAKASGQPRAARTLWPEVEALKIELLGQSKQSKTAHRDFTRSPDATLSTRPAHGSSR